MAERGRGRPKGREPHPNGNNKYSEKDGKFVAPVAFHGICEALDVSERALLEVVLPEAGIDPQEHLFEGRIVFSVTVTNHQIIPTVNRLKKDGTIVPTSRIRRPVINGRII